MNKDYAPYEESLELKGLGFNEPCLFAFDNCSTPMRCSDLRTNEQQFSGVDYNSSSYTSQPTFSQAFRFFREKYGLSGLIEIGTREFSYQVFDAKGNKQLGNEPLRFNGTYEEAELALLRKLIEIAKQHKKD
jgi:hypothetical protein